MTGSRDLFARMSKDLGARSTAENQWWAAQRGLAKTELGYDGLPLTWVPREDDHNRTYYVNTETGKTSWNPQDDSSDNSSEDYSSEDYSSEDEDPVVNKWNHKMIDVRIKQLSNKIEHLVDGELQELQAEYDNQDCNSCNQIGNPNICCNSLMNPNYCKWDPIKNICENIRH